MELDLNIEYNNWLLVNAQISIITKRYQEALKNKNTALLLQAKQAEQNLIRFLKDLLRKDDNEESFQNN
ncbi:MAG: hypothetical protein N2560_01615 [Ignavibacteria bacterium]|nr:hypothetical protein [Ignavibacteria bacterium]